MCTPQDTLRKDIDTPQDLTGTINPESNIMTGKGSDPITPDSFEEGQASLLQLPGGPSRASFQLLKMTTLTLNVQEEKLG
eukprot:15767637-Heterocapsa_arctica.AAC.1